MKKAEGRAEIHLPRKEVIVAIWKPPNVRYYLGETDAEGRTTFDPKQEIWYSNDDWRGGRAD